MLFIVAKNTIKKLSMYCNDSTYLPIKKKEHIIKSIEAILFDNFDSAVTCHKVDKKYHPLKSLTLINQIN